MHNVTELTTSLSKELQEPVPLCEYRLVYLLVVEGRAEDMSEAFGQHPRSSSHLYLTVNLQQEQQRL